MTNDKTTILIIDDEPSNIQVIINLLQNDASNFKIISASDSQLGLEIAVQTSPDIIITDWEMPKLSGIDLIRELKKNETTHDIPIIMATGVNTSSHDLKQALEVGAYDFIRKPIDEIELIARLNSALRFVKDFQIRIEYEKKIASIQEEKRLAEIESQKRELLAKTMILQKVNHLHNNFQERLQKVECGVKKEDCEVYCFSRTYTNEIIKNGNDQLWQELELNFEKINEEFYKNIITRFPDLTPNERKLCAYLRLNLSTKDICAITSQTLRSIEIARTRLRDKLGLKNSETDLNSFLLHF